MVLVRGCGVGRAVRADPGVRTDHDRLGGVDLWMACPDAGPEVAALDIADVDHA